MLGRFRPSTQCFDRLASAPPISAVLRALHRPEVRRQALALRLRRLGSVAGSGHGARTAAPHTEVLGACGHMRTPATGPILMAKGLVGLAEDDIDIDQRAGLNGRGEGLETLFSKRVFGPPVWSTCHHRKCDPLRILAGSEMCAVIAPDEQDSESAAVSPHTTVQVTRPACGGEPGPAAPLQHRPTAQCPWIQAAGAGDRPATRGQSARRSPGATGRPPLTT